MITKQMAMTLQHGQVLEHKTAKNADGTPARARVNGRCRTWKTRPEEFRVPLKIGWNGYTALDQWTAENWSIVGG